MDVKFHRPVRSVRVRNDENVPPHGHAAKTIHQRNKSSPALSTIASGPGLKAAPQRAAFGDLSNIASGLRPSKDDSALNRNHAVQSLGEQKPAILSKPASRPLSLAGWKNVLTGGSHNGHPATASHDPVEQTGVAVATQVGVRKAGSKRHTVVYKDNGLAVVQEAEINLPPVELPSVLPVTHSQVLPGDVPVVGHVRDYPHGDGTKAVTVPGGANDVAEPQSEISLPGIDEVNLGPSLSSDDRQDASVDDNIHVASDVPASGPIAELPANMAAAKPVLPSAAAETITVVSSAETQPAIVADVDYIEAVPPPPPPPSHHDYVLPQTEHEEYWDGEDEDTYDEEGYVTARSFRSRGENTTGGASTILFPYVNQRTRKELAAAKQLVEATRSPEDIEDEGYDTSMVTEYGDEIFDYMRKLELKMLPNAHYMDNQHEIQWSMRSVLMDWLVQVHLRFNLLPETLFLCVNYIDRFLSCKVVSLGKLQLVGATAIFIAAKYEEINCPSVQEIVYMVDGGYSMEEILKAERFMLTMLQFELGWPGPMSFLRRISKADDYDLETRTLAKYFLEVTLMDERFIGSPPSFAAAASHCLARMMLRKGYWSAHHVFYAGYTYSQLKPLLNLLLECCDDPRKHHSAVFNKYCDKRYKRASAFVEGEMQRGFQLPDSPGLGVAAPSSMLPYYDSVSYFRA